SISAASDHRVTTTDKAGAAGGVAISPSVSITIVTDDTTARLGTGGALTVSGAATIQATETQNVITTSDGDSKADNVAVGAAVSINVAKPNTTAAVARNLTATAVTIASTTTLSSDIAAKASTGGEEQEDDGGKKADDQSSDQVENNPNTAGKTDGALPKA